MSAPALLRDPRCSTSLGCVSASSARVYITYMAAPAGVAALVANPDLIVLDIGATLCRCCSSIPVCLFF